MRPAHQALTARGLSRLFAVAALSVLAACGGSRPQAGAAGHATEATTPPLPASAVELLPAAFDSALRVDVEALRRSSLWGHALEVAKSRCIALGRYELLLERTDLLVGGTDEQGEGLGAAVLQGRVTADDADALLGLFAQDPAQLPPAQQGKHGRFTVSERAPVAASFLGEGLAVVGDSRALRTVLDVADGKAPSARQGLLGDGLGQAVQFEQAALAAIYRPSESDRERLQRELGSTGRAALPRGLMDGSRGAFSITLGEPLVLRAAVESASPGAADELTKATQSSLMQLNLLLRLAGMPALLERVEAQTQGAVSAFSLQVSRAELDALWSRVQEVQAADPPACDGVAL